MTNDNRYHHGHRTSLDGGFRRLLG